MDKTPDKSLVDDLADVLTRMTVGWEFEHGVNLPRHPDVVRVMARYRAEAATLLSDAEARGRQWAIEKLHQRAADKASAYYYAAVYLEAAQKNA